MKRGLHEKPHGPATYWLTRFVILRLLGLVYAIAFYIAAKQIIPLIGAHGLLPANDFLSRVHAHLDSTISEWIRLPTIFWFDCSDTALVAVSWTGVALSLVVVSGFANSILLGVLWFLYMSIIHVGQDWYSYGWEIQLLETGFLAIFFVPLLDPRPFPRREPPIQIIYLYRWLIARIMLGAGLIKIRGDSCWRDLTALNYFYETQPIPGPLSRWFHFLPRAILKGLTMGNHIVELGAPWLAFGPRIARTIAGSVFIIFQVVLILGGNLSFLNYLTIIPALACFDDAFYKRLFPSYVLNLAAKARAEAKPYVPMTCAAWTLTALVAILSIDPVFNMVSANQIMNTSFDPLHIVNTYGAFGSVGKERYVIIFEGTNDDPDNPNTVWKQYPFVGLPCDPAKAPPQIAPYQPRLDWQLWFAAMGTPAQYPWAFHLVLRMLQNDPGTLSLFAGNPFPDKAPRYIRAVLYVYKFALPANAKHDYWNREPLGLWLPAFSLDEPEFRSLLRQLNWLD